MASLTGIVVAVAVVAAGTLVGEKPVFICGMLAAAVSLANIGWQAVKLHSGYAWVGLAFIGIGVILSASLIEKRQAGQLPAGTALWGRLKPRWQ